jgi:hypothetical protein
MNEDRNYKVKEGRKEGRKRIDNVKEERLWKEGGKEGKKEREEGGKEGGKE